MNINRAVSGVITEYERLVVWEGKLLHSGTIVTNYLTVTCYG